MEATKIQEETMEWKIKSIILREVEFENL